MKKTKVMVSKQEEIKTLVKSMLRESYENMLSKIDKVLDSGCIDVDGWDNDYLPMRLPKCIVTAILQNESKQYEGKGTSFEKELKKEVKNIRYFL